MKQAAPPPVPGSRYAGAVALFVVGGITQYMGAAVAVGAFEQIPALAVSWWRVALAALILLAWRRPWRGQDRTWWRSAVLFGVVLAAMNAFFYLAIDRIPLGTAVAIEFLGPIAVAAATGRGWNQRAAIAAGGLGVVVIGGLGLDWNTAGTGFGLAAALVAGAMWAAYIVLGMRLSTRAKGVDVLAVGMTAGMIVFLPLAFLTPPATFTNPGLLAALLFVALASSVVPYVVDQLNFGILPPATFAILLALLPATSLVVGAIALAQIPGAFDLVGLGLVSVAVLLANLPSGSARPRARLAARPDSHPDSNPASRPGSGPAS